MAVLVIGILGEFDALPGLAQSSAPYKEKINNETGAGHACGHHFIWSSFSLGCSSCERMDSGK